MTTPAAHRASNRFGLRLARTGPRSEDAQPNESVNRRQRHPPTVNSVAQSRRSWRVGRGQNRPPATRQNIHSVARERTGSTRRPPPSTSARHAVPHARPLSLATAGGTGCLNTARSSTDTGPRSPRQSHSASALEMLTPGSPVPKRQELVGSPRVEVKLEIPPETMVSSITSSVSPVSSETLVGDHKVKVERSISPELYTQPQLNTSGSKRYAPLPPECRKSHPNHAAARFAWARKEQEALRRLGLRVVRSFIREDGMVIDWEAIDSELTDIAAVIERALLLNDAASRDPPVMSVERAISPLTSPSQSSKWPHLDGGNDKDVPFAGEIAPLPSLNVPTGLAPFVAEPGTDVCNLASSGMDRRSQSQTQPSHMDIGDNDVASVHTSAPIVCFLEEDLRSTAPAAALPPFIPSPRHPRPSIHQITSNALHPSTPSSEMRTRASSSQSSRLLHGRSTSPRRFPSPPPSQPALDALHHILKLKRQISRSSSSAGPSTASPSPSCPSLRRLYPAPKKPQPKSPSKRPAESSADVVAAALNESARLSQGGSGRASASSTPLRVYKRRRQSPPVALVRGNGESTAPHNEPGHRERDSLSPKRHSSPHIGVQRPAGATPWSPLTELTPSVSGDEGELDLSYPLSPKPRFLDMISQPLPPVEPPRPVEPMELVGGASLSSPELPSPQENAAMQSAALQFLQRYGQTFDTDQRALAEAYTPHATFSCPSRGLRIQGRDGILDALTMLGHGVLCSERNVEYDVFPVPGIGVLLVVLGTMIRAQDNKDVGYTMSFVLQPGDGDHENRESGRDTGQWPLVVVMHQMVLREDS